MEYAYDYDSGKLKFYANRCNYDLDLPRDIVILTGDSGTGKSLLVSNIREKKQFELIKYSTDISFKNIECYDLSTNDIRNGTDDTYDDYSYQSVFSLSIDNLKNKNRCLIIIDNADIIVTRELMEYITNDTNNKYLLIGKAIRSLKPYIDNYGELYLDKGVFKIRYSLTDY